MEDGLANESRYEFEQTRWEKVKNHFSRNKSTYISTCVGFVAGVAACYVLSKSDEDISGDVLSLDISGDNVEVKDVSVNGTHVHNVTINNAFCGHQAKIVKNVDTGEIFESQRLAAASIGVDERTMSKHLNGQRDSLNGQHFERIGLGTV